MKSYKYNLRIKAFDPRSADKAVFVLMELLKSHQVDFIGPMPLPTKKVITTVLKSTHINKTSREQFELFTHKRLIRLNLKEENLNIVEKIEQLELPAGASLTVLSARSFNAKNRIKTTMQLEPRK